MSKSLPVWALAGDVIANPSDTANSRAMMTGEGCMGMMLHEFSE
ncbi:methionine aminopeptidase [Roseovarius sp. TM1035]|jgi:hypothetical protein|nr:Hypothetical protein RAK1035_2206 [Roseovarius sp. AK1035]EDM32791.1 methionine aminopeptidase [Roseovarius sp. TM1035]